MTNLCPETTAVWSKLNSEDNDIVFTSENASQVFSKIIKLSMKDDNYCCWRGQANSEWSLMSSIQRFMKRNNRVDWNNEQSVKKVESEIIRRCKEWNIEDSNKRINAQSARFLFGESQTQENSLMYCFSTDVSKKLFKTIIIKSNLKKEICSILKHKFGIRRRELFPDFTGFSDPLAKYGNVLMDAIDFGGVEIKNGK